MQRAQRRSLALVVTCIVATFTFLVASACSSSNPGSGFGSSGGTSSGTGSSSGTKGASSSGTASGGASSGVTFKEDGGTTPPPLLTDGGCQGLQCQIAASCTNDGGTTITGTIMDPAGANPLYNVLAYVPMFDPADPSKIPAGAGIEPIAGGVTFPSGVSCDSCSYLYSGNPIAVGVSGTDGTFTITNAPSGTNIPVVVQVGKWRTHTTVATVTDCHGASAGNIDLPSSASGSDPIVSMPQIAISMGMADTMECLPYRIGLDISEFTSGASSTGHVHIFSGGGGFGGGGSSVPSAPSTLWDSLADLEKYDVTLFSCEGQETASANPPLLEQYVNAGGRAFLSHFHYAWLAGPLSTGSSAGYSANADWGSNLATWNGNDQGADEGATLPAEITTTLNVGGGTFAKGVALEQWLSDVHALGTSGASSTEVAVASPSFDPSVNVVERGLAAVGDVRHDRRPLVGLEHRQVVPDGLLLLRHTGRRHGAAGRRRAALLRSRRLQRPPCRRGGLGHDGWIVDALVHGLQPGPRPALAAGESPGVHAVRPLILRHAGQGGAGHSHPAAPSSAAPAVSARGSTMKLLRGG